MSVDARKLEAMSIHIEGLQVTLTKRNKRIEELEAQVVALKKSPITEPALKKAYRSGWQDCAMHLKETALDAARKLREIDKQAFDLYLEGEKK